MRAVLAAFAVLLVSCVDPERDEIDVTVTDPRGVPIASAIVGVVCTPSGDGGALTDRDGVAHIVIYNSEPETCTITVTAPGFRTAQLVDVAGGAAVMLEVAP